MGIKWHFKVKMGLNLGNFYDVFIYNHPYIFYKHGSVLPAGIHGKEEEASLLSKSRRWSCCHKGKKSSLPVLPMVPKLAEKLKEALESRFFWKNRSFQVFFGWISCVC